MINGSTIGLSVSVYMCAYEGRVIFNIVEKERKKSTVVVVVFFLFCSLFILTVAIASLNLLHLNIEFECWIDMCRLCAYA